MIPAIKIEQVQKHFGGLAALKGIDLTIEQGEFFALLGPNGAGKSTLINLLAGLLRPTSGKLSVLGYDVQAQYAEARRALPLKERLARSKALADAMGPGDPDFDVRANTDEMWGEA